MAFMKKWIFRAPFVRDSGEMARDIYEVFAYGVCCAY